MDVRVRSHELGRERWMARATACASRVTARLGFEPRACGVRRPRAPRRRWRWLAISRDFAACECEDPPSCHAPAAAPAGVQNAPLRVYLSVLACRAGRVRQRPFSSTSFCRGLHLPVQNERHLRLRVGHNVQASVLQCARVSCTRSHCRFGVWRRLPLQDLGCKRRRRVGGAGWGGEWQVAKAELNFCHDLSALLFVVVRSRRRGT